MASPGEIYRHGAFYLDEQSRWLPKYLVLLARLPGDDLIFRLLTSRQRDRPRDPPCFHGDPFPGFYVGHIGSPLDSETWIDLRPSEDYDGHSFRVDMREGTLQRVAALSMEMLRPLLACAAQAPDTTNQQSHAIRDLIASMPSVR